MKKTDIKRIIRQGSTKQKIKLYFTDIAYFNTIGIETVQINASGDTLDTLDRPEKILTDKEKSIIVNSIKETKDVEYWEHLRACNKAFLMFKPTITTYVETFNYLTAELSKCTIVRLLHKSYEDAINNILEVVKEKKLRETLVKAALNSLKQFDANRYQKKGFLPVIGIPDANTNGNVLRIVDVLNEKIQDAKEYIKAMEIFLHKNLPLQPYEQFLREEENKIKAKIQECKTLLELFKAIDEKAKDKLLNWDEVEVEIADEDIEDIKKAGI